MGTFVNVLMWFALGIAAVWISLGVSALRSEASVAGYGWAFMALWPEYPARLATPVALLAFGLGVVPPVPSWMRLLLLGMSLPVAGGQYMARRWQDNEMQKMAEKYSASGTYKLCIIPREQALDALRWWTFVAMVAAAVGSFVCSGIAMIHYGQDPTTWIMNTLFLIGVYVASTLASMWYCAIARDLWKTDFVPIAVR